MRVRPKLATLAGLVLPLAFAGLAAASHTPARPTPTIPPQAANLSASLTQATAPGETPSQALLPDLVVSGTCTSPASATSPRTVWIYIKNQGTAPADPFWVFVQRNSTDSIGLDKFEVFGLPAGVTDAFPVSASKSFPRRIYVDMYHQVVESNEDNQTETIDPTNACPW